MRVNIRPSVDHSKLKLTPQEDKIMKECLAQSFSVWTGLVDGEIACVWGVIPPTLLSEIAYLWLYTTELVKEHQFLFVRHSQREIEHILVEYPTIIGVTNAEAKHSIRWLKWLGATFKTAEDGQLAFIIRRK